MTRRDSSSDGLVLRLERAVRRFRLQSAHNLLDEAFGAHPPEAVLEAVGRPLLDRLAASGDVGATQFARSLLEARLLAQARGWERGSGPSVLLACAPGDGDVLELISLGLRLAVLRCQILYLGATTPWTGVHEVVRRQAPAAIVISAGAPGLGASERAALRALSTPLVVIGHARDGLAETVGGTPLDGALPATAPRILALARERSPRASDDRSPCFRPG